MDGKADGGAEEGRTVEQLMEDIHTLAEEVRRHRENMVAMKPEVYDPDVNHYKYVCGNCRHKVFREWNFCTFHSENKSFET